MQESEQKLLQNQILSLRVLSPKAEWSWGSDRVQDCPDFTRHKEHLCKLILTQNQKLKLILIIDMISKTHLFANCIYYLYYSSHFILAVPWCREPVLFWLETYFHEEALTLVGLLVVLKRY